MFIKVCVVQWLAPSAHSKKVMGLIQGLLQFKHVHVRGFENFKLSIWVHCCLFVWSCDELATCLGCICALNNDSWNIFFFCDHFRQSLLSKKVEFRTSYPSLYAVNGMEIDGDDECGLYPESSTRSGAVWWKWKTVLASCGRLGGLQLARLCTGTPASTQNNPSPPKQTHMYGCCTRTDTRRHTHTQWGWVAWTGCSIGRGGCGSIDSHMDRYMQMYHGLIAPSIISAWCHWSRICSCQFKVSPEYTAHSWWVRVWGTASVQVVGHQHTYLPSCCLCLSVIGMWQLFLPI